MSGVRESALALASEGFRVFWLPAKRKDTTLKDWPNLATTERATVEEWFSPNSARNIAIATGRGLLVLDVDPKNGGDDGLEALTMAYELPATREARTPSGGRHFYFRVPADLRVANSVESLGQGLDIRGDGGYVAAPPSVTNTGAYTWANDAAIADAPEWLLSETTKPRESQDATGEAESKKNDYTAGELRNLLTHLDPDADYQSWFDIVVAAGRASKGAKDGESWFEAVDSWSAQGAKYKGTAEVRAKWLEADKRETGWGLGHLIDLAKKRGYVPPPPVRMECSSDDFDSHGEAAPAAPTFVVPDAANACTDQRNAARLERASKTLLRSMAGEFYTYNGKVWAPETNESSVHAAKLSAIVGREIESLERQLVPTLARLSADDLASYNSLALLARPSTTATYRKLMQVEAGKAVLGLAERIQELRKWRRECEMLHRQSAALLLLKNLVNLPVDDMDKKRHLLNCANGTVDLRTGTLQPHSSGDYISQIAPTNYDPQADCPRFKAFMLEIMGGDADMVTFMQRSLGYSLTGEIKEQKWWLHVGEGSNGKTTLFDVIRGVAGSSGSSRGFVHTVASTLLAADKAAQRHTTEIADLRGRRLCTASETEDGDRLREALIKNVTGESSLSGRFMYQDNITFESQAKLHLLTNKKPIIKGQDKATWRRIMLVEYRVTAGNEQEVASGAAQKLVDPNLLVNLLTESEGILAWLVQGAVDWYRDGLRIPEKVRLATLSYQKEEDRVAEFVTTECDTDSGSWASLSDIYEVYRLWCGRSGFQPLSKTRLARELSRVVPGFESKEHRRKVGEAWRTVTGSYGLRLHSLTTFESLSTPDDDLSAPPAQTIQ